MDGIIGGKDFEIVMYGKEVFIWVVLWMLMETEQSTLLMTSCPSS